ncbi:MAG: cupin [Cereibacter sp.]
MPVRLPPFTGRKVFGHDRRDAGRHPLPRTEPARKPIHPDHRMIVNIHNAPFRPFVCDDGLAPGDDILQRGGDQPTGRGFHVCRMPAGMTTRGHRRNGHEQFPILKGELIASDGTMLRKGDMVFYRDGTEHKSRTPNGCLLTAHIAGPEFSADGG